MLQIKCCIVDDCRIYLRDGKHGLSQAKSWLHFFQLSLFTLVCYSILATPSKWQIWPGHLFICYVYKSSLVFISLCLFTDNILVKNNICVLFLFCKCEYLSWRHHLTTAALNTLKLRQNDHHFIDKMSRLIFLYENCCILIQISLGFAPSGSINDRHWLK